MMLLSDVVAKGMKKKKKKNSFCAISADDERQNGLPWMLPIT